MLNKLKKWFASSGPSGSSDGFFLKVRCKKCSEEFNLFINTSTSLAQNYDDPGGPAYFMNKEIIGGQCHNRMQVRMEFDKNRRLVSRTIEGGEFLE